MKFKRQAREELQLNLTSLIDVVFLLLIFFMVSTTFTKENHLAISLPEADGEVAETSAKSIEVVIDKTGAYSVNGQTLVNNQISTIKSALEKVSDGKRDLPFVITADANTPHQAVVRAMDAAGQLGFVHLSITSKKPE